MGAKNVKKYKSVLAPIDSLKNIEVQIIVVTSEENNEVFDESKIAGIPEQVLTES